MFLAIVGGAIAVAVAVAALYDFRVRRKGGRAYASTEDAFQSRVPACHRAAAIALQRSDGEPHL